jgi:hypothetical protein
MSTSLSQQLQRLKAPQTQVIAATKKGVSILFDSKEAENTSIDTAYDLGRFQIFILGFAYIM